jgi:enterochelin esterase-like enzyme
MVYTRSTFSVRLFRVMLFVCGALGLAVLRAEPQPALIPGTQVSLLESKATGRTYRITVYTPPHDPAVTPAPVYPVVYILDGLWNFARVESLRNALVFDGQMPEVVLVAVDYPATVPEVLKLRQKDLTLGSAADPGPSGGAPEFLEFLTGELDPWVAARYPVNPAERVLTGHSYAGHFALYAWAAKPGFYGRVLAGSPYWNEALQGWLASGAAPATGGAYSRLDVSSGVTGREYDDCIVTPARVAVVRSARARLGLAGETRFALYPELKHAAIVHPIYSYGLPWLFATTPGSEQTYSWSVGIK